MEQENTEASTVLRIPPDIDAFGTALFIQQMDCWGQDTKRAEGNLFLQYGFARERPPAGVEGGFSAYCLHLDDQRSLALWGFGLFYLDTQIGGMFLRRRSFAPKLASTPSLPTNVWRLADMPATTLPTTVLEGHKTCMLLSAALLWISNYEKWVKSTLGEAYRLGYLEQKDEAITPPQGLDAEWERLAELCRSFVVDDD